MKHIKKAIKWVSSPFLDEDNNPSLANISLATIVIAALHGVQMSPATVTAAGMFVAHHAGLKVMAHRQTMKKMDIDSQNNSADVKNIIDANKTQIDALTKKVDNVVNTVVANQTPRRPLGG